MSDSGRTVDELISRLTVIDQQPLDQRAGAFSQIHDELRSTLEDARGQDGR